MSFIGDDGLVYTGSQLIIPGYWNLGPPFHTRAGLENLPAVSSHTPNLCFSAPESLLFNGISSESEVSRSYAPLLITAMLKVLRSREGRIHSRHQRRTDVRLIRGHPVSAFETWELCLTQQGAFQRPSKDLFHFAYASLNWLRIMEV